MDASIERGVAVFGHGGRLVVICLIGFGASGLSRFARCAHVPASRVTVMRQFAEAQSRRV
ncbi:hypothetical protein GCM10010987_68560 [Bradyrhizobium guangdongense]|uniref:Uncharacterized protein n=1 Tax=Bradyrhizobium guangdongense TaxID=1325090 RepID=A0AA88BBY4_9BRAD|nr:hypothetical protein GCM10010987_68560 [Bradyrhizobium guangdongense]